MLILPRVVTNFCSKINSHQSRIFYIASKNMYHYNTYLLNNGSVGKIKFILNSTKRKKIFFKSRELRIRKSNLSEPFLILTSYVLCH